MSKSQRLIELMMTVNTKRKFTARELAEEFGAGRMRAMDATDILRNELLAFADSTHHPKPIHSPGPGVTVIGVLMAL